MTRLLALLPLFCGSGCCSLARLFCGPDKSDWEQIAYDTPEQTLATLLAALRRDNFEQLRRCLTERYQEQLGFGSAEVPIVRDQMHRDLPYLFMAGYAKVPEQPVSRSDGGRTFEIEVKGQQLRIDLVRQSYTRVVYEDDDELIQAGEYLKHDSWNGRATLARAEPLPVDNTQRSTVDLAPILFQHGAYTDLPLKRLHLVALGREWKIDLIHEREGPER